MALGAAFAGPIGSTSPLNTVVLILWNVEVNRLGPMRSPFKELVKGVRIALNIHHETRVVMDKWKGGKGAGAIVKTGMQCCLWSLECVA
jgi:hypothetical protein